jgi:hypothetical protein
MQALKGVVILMTVTIAVLMTLIVYGMYQKSQDPEFKFFDLSGGEKPAATTNNTSAEAGADTPAAAPPVLNPTTRAFGDITLALPAGARITSATVSGERLVIVVNNEPQGHEQVWVVDLTTGQVLGRVKTQETP